MSILLELFVQQFKWTYYKILNKTAQFLVLPVTYLLLHHFTHDTQNYKSGLEIARETFWSNSHFPELAGMIKWTE